MCYDVSYLRQKIEKYKRTHDLKNIEEVVKKIPKAYHMSGFDHPDLPVVTKEDIHTLQSMEWGLIPFFVKDAAQATSIANKTLNARGETIFEKPSFKNSAKNMRCAVLLDNFYEHKHLNDKTTVPHLIGLKEEKPFWVGGLYSVWKLGDIKKVTVSLITTEANPMMKDIHNGGPNAGRMPFIVPDEMLEDWLKIEADDKPAKDHILEMIKPYDQDEMQAYTVGRLRGKSAVGNHEDVLREVKYQQPPPSLF